MDKKKLIALALSSIIAGHSCGVAMNEKPESKIDITAFSMLLYTFINERVYQYNQKELEEYKRLNPEFPKYNLSEEELAQITRLCSQEQGSLEGVAAEATLMANRREKYAKNSTLTSYLRNSGWFARANYYMDYGKCTKEELEIVRQVLVEGKRTMPIYVDEHDSFSDVSYINTGNAGNINDYISGETIVHNVYDSTYVYYGRPGTNDVFGYHSKGQESDAHYEFERLLER